MTDNSLHNRHVLVTGAGTGIGAVQHVRLAVVETEDFVRAFQAFADKRKPVFEGN